jgi:hypothetical protein
VVFTALTLVTGQALAQALIDYADLDLSPSKEGQRRWRPLKYEVSSKYPYLYELPSWREIPTLLKWIRQDRQVYGAGMAYEQLVVMSRVDFKMPTAQSPSHVGVVSNYNWSQSITGWSNWWATIGKGYQERIARGGREDMEAWRLITRGRSVPPPTYRVAIPDEWVFKSTLAGGDYDARPLEVLTLKRTRKEAWLIRAVRQNAKDRLRWEEWQPISTEQADTFALAVAYAIDHPWLVIRNEVKQERGQKEGRRFGLYYPWFHFQFSDLQGNIWWNDPARWFGINEAGDGWGLGAVCTTLWRRFPELAQQREVPSPQAGWREVSMPSDDRVLAEAIEDLRVPDNVIEHLWWDQRMSLALKTLEQFGSREHVSAINRMEQELSERMRMLSAVLDADANGSHPKRVAEELLANARRARTACQSGMRTFLPLELGPGSILDR